MPFKIKFGHGFYFILVRFSWMRTTDANNTLLRIDIVMPLNFTEDRNTLIQTVFFSLLWVWWQDWFLLNPHQPERHLNSFRELPPLLSRGLGNKWILKWSKYIQNVQCCVKSERSPSFQSICFDSLEYRLRQIRVISNTTQKPFGTGGSIVGWGTMLQAGRSRPRVDSASNRNEYQESSWGVKGGRRLRLTALPTPVSQLSRENVGASTSHNPMGLHGLLQE
jgi:hypothetical protein